MPYEVQPVAFPFELRGDDILDLNRSDTEGDECRRNMDRAMLCLEGAAHRVLSSDGGQPEGLLHLQRSKQRCRGFPPGMRIGSHSLEIFLTRETHCLPVSSGGDNLGTGLNE